MYCHRFQSHKVDADKQMQKIAMVEAVLKTRWTDATKLTNVIIAGFRVERVEIWSEKDRCSSKMKPRLRAEWVVLSEELCILANCLLSPMSRNSVLEELRVKRLAAIQEEICCRAF